MFRIGQGFDVHAFEEGRPLIIGGITIPHEKGLVGHSDADVLLHTVTDAALGAIGEGTLAVIFLILIQHLRMQIQQNYLSIFGKLLRIEVMC